MHQAEHLAAPARVSLRPGQSFIILSLLILALLPATTSIAEAPLPDQVDDPARNPAGAHVLDGSYVMNAGQLHMNITNHGLIGSQYSVVSSFADAPSGQYPAGSGIEYLWAAGIWIGGLKNGIRSVSTGQYERELRPRARVEDTIYESRDATVIRPRIPGSSGFRFPYRRYDDDQDGMEDEELLNGHDDDGDGLLEEDYAQVGDQMMVCTMYDNTPLADEIYTDHRPLNIKVTQSAHAWYGHKAEDFVAFDFEITNLGGASIKDVHIGMLVDCDIGPRVGSGVGQNDLAGYFDGLWRIREGQYVPLRVGYMHDAPGPEHVPGYFGFVVLDHPTRLYDEQWAGEVGVNAFRIFSSQEPFERGGDPSNDEERYEAMSRPFIAKNTDPVFPNDLRFLISSGPFGEMGPSESFHYRGAFVAGNSLEEMLDHAAIAAESFYGTWYNRDRNYYTGINGRESWVCLSDFPTRSGESLLFSRTADALNMDCVSKYYLTWWRVIDFNDFNWNSDFQDYCLMANVDNCTECERRKGSPCDQNDMGYYYPCLSRSVPDDMAYGCTGVNGREYFMPWTLVAPPPTPALRLWPRDKAVHIFWNSLGELTLDDREYRDDFESYRIWRADYWDRPAGSSLENGPPEHSWAMIDEYDLDNTFVHQFSTDHGVVVRDTLPLGRNTGLDTILYVPRILSDPQYDGLAAAMQQWVDRDTMGHTWMPPVLDEFGLVNDGMDILVPWAEYPAALDTFFRVSSRDPEVGSPVPPKVPQRFYEYVDRNVKNGFLYFYSVTTRDHEFENGRPDEISGLGVQGSPRSYFAATSPATDAVAAGLEGPDHRDVFVYPNPATRESLGDFQEMYPNADDPTGVRIRFANLPQAHNIIKIFTLSGDLVQEIPHDGSGGYGEASWNLVSRNGQQIVSGIYLYTVDSDDEDFEKTVGKFVVIR